MINVSVSEEFKQLALKTRGERGLAWAESLTGLIAHCEENFRVVFTEEMDNL